MIRLDEFRRLYWRSYLRFPVALVSGAAPERVSGAEEVHIHVDLPPWDIDIDAGDVRKFDLVGVSHLKPTCAREC